MLKTFDEAAVTAVYGHPLAGVIDPDPAAQQVSPLFPGESATLEGLAPGTLAAMTMLAPPGTVERRYALALTLKALATGGVLTAMAPKDKGGSRLRKELEGFGCRVEESSKAHHRICICAPPAQPIGLDAAIEDGAPRLIEALGLWSQPGVFSWNRIDPGSELLAKHLPALSGRGADLGCGVGYLSRAVLAAPTVEALSLIDNDRRAIDAARRNIEDPRARLIWADVNTVDPEDGSKDLDFVVMNPPFHDAGTEHRGLGQAFIRRAAEMLKPRGVLWLVANRHLPYEFVLAEAFAKVTVVVEHGGYKVFEARK
jgi:16S rRNA (guanine1207-N2)-methyltransferase